MSSAWMTAGASYALWSTITSDYPNSMLKSYPIILCSAPTIMNSINTSPNRDEEMLVPVHHNLWAIKVFPTTRIWITIAAARNNSVIKARMLETTQQKLMVVHLGAHPCMKYSWCLPAKPHRTSRQAKSRDIDACGLITMAKI